MIYRLERNVFRPEYIVLYEFVFSDNFYAYEACMHKFNSLDMYELEKAFYTDLGEKDNELFKLFRRQRFLFKLKPNLKPF